MSNESQSAEIQQLRKSLRRTQGLLAALILVLPVSLLMGADRVPQVLKARGLVIVDGEGRAKILLGAPTPETADRLRKDAQTESLVFLGEDGSDRVIVGQTPDPYQGGQTSKRIAQNWGLVFSDPKGTERGGMGFLGEGRAAMALDRPNGDAVGMMVDDQAHYAGFMVNYPTQEKTAMEFAVVDNQAFIRALDPEGRTRAKLVVSGSNQPSWEFYDAATAPKDPQ